MLRKNHTKEGVFNEKLTLKKLLNYIKSVYQIPQKINRLTDSRKRKTIPFFNLMMPVFMCFLLQYESFHTMFSSPFCMEKKLKHCIKGRIPKIDAIRDALSMVNPTELRSIHEEVIHHIYKNRVLQGGTIGGYKTVAIDGMELFSSTKKSCLNCLTRKNKKGETEYFHRSVVCATIGKSPHIIVGQEWLHKRDGEEKDEGELTGAKRLIKRLKERHGHFADVIVADGLYLNAPFINIVLENKMEVVIRLKDETRQIYKDAEGLFIKGEGRKSDFQKGKRKIEVWDIFGFEMEGIDKKVRVIRYQEREEKKGKIEEQEMWLVTTLEIADYRVLWEMMHRRWDIEENVFHQLKTYYHTKHCYCHRASEVILWLMILAFNMRELYLYRRVHGFQEMGITRKSMTEKWRDELQMEKVWKLLYDDSG